MSKAQAVKFVGVSFDRLSQLAITVMVSIILFFGKELYGDIKQLKVDSALDKQEHAALIEFKEEIRNRLTKLEK